MVQAQEKTHKCQWNRRLAIFPTHIDGNLVSDKVTFPNRKWEKLDYSINDIEKWHNLREKSQNCASPKYILYGSKDLNLKVYF